MLIQKYIHWKILLILSVLCIHQVGAQTFNWVHISANSPPWAQSAGLAFDPASNQLVLFGGEILDFATFKTAFNNRTSTWNGSQWNFLNPITSPSARSGVAMALDPTSNSIILFGGTGTSTERFRTVFFDDTWQWDSTNNTWIQKFPKHKPPARAFAAIAPDPIHGQLVLFGGQSKDGLFDDTWIWDGNDWIQQHPAHHPSARAGAAMAFDSNTCQIGQTGNIILFGGNTTINNFLQDTWQWNGQDWTEIFPASIPPARTKASMAFHPSTNQLLLFGGRGSSTILNDTWGWDGTNWTQLNPPLASTPYANEGTAMAFDCASKQLILFNGIFLSFRPPSPTWAWLSGGSFIDGPVITNISPSTGPEGTTVIITGLRFTDVASVTFGSKQATIISSTATQITVNAPAGTGTVDVRVTTPIGSSPLTPADQFTYTSSILSPIHLKGFQKANQFADQTDYINIITWKANPEGTPAVAYRIYRDRQLNELIAVISANQHLRFKDHNRKKGKTYVYFIVAIDQFGNTSPPAKIKVKGKN
jgi:hypothetical protein